MIYLNNVLIILALTLSPLSFAENILKLEYSGYTLWLDCDRRGAVVFQYEAGADHTNHKRHRDFYSDPNVPRDCQQKSTRSYQRKLSPVGYDRGHLVPANHMDFSEKAIMESNYMLNIIPQLASNNRKGGAWYRTEMIVECMRDSVPVTVVGGVLWGNDYSDDYFYPKHGIRTPDALWKILVAQINGKTALNAWIIPNTIKAPASNLNDYLVSVNDIESQTGTTVYQISEDLKHAVAKVSWPVKHPCNFM